MKKLLIIALGVGVLGSATAASSVSAQDLSIGLGVGPRYYDDRPGLRPPPQPRAYYESRPDVYRERSERVERVERECWVERRWVETPYGPEARRVRICE